MVRRRGTTQTALGARDRSRSPVQHDPRWNPTAPLRTWYKDQLLAKLQELRHPNIAMLKKSRVPALVKALEEMGFNPGNEATHQRQNEDPATESQQGGLAPNSNQEQVEQTVKHCMNRMTPEMVQSVLSVLEQRNQTQVRTQAPWPADPPADVIAQMEPPGQRQGPQGSGMDIPINLGVGLVPRSSSGRVTVNPYLGLGQGVGRVANESPGICTERPRPAESQPHQSRSDILSQSNLALGLGPGVGAQPLVQDREGWLQNGRDRVESSPSDTGNVLATQIEYLGTWGIYVNPQKVFEAFVAANQPISTAFGVPESVKKKAWQGKNVPLYMFLPGFSEQEPGGNPVLMPVPGKGVSLPSPRQPLIRTINCHGDSSPQLNLQQHS